MPTVDLPGLGDDPTNEEVINAFEKQRKYLIWLLNKNLDTKNTREIAGWLIRPDKIVSNDGDVGMATTDTTGDDIRFFAGPDGSGGFLFYVTKGGLMVAQNASIKGTIEALAGHIGGFTIENDRLSSDSGHGIIQGGTIIGSEIKTSVSAYPRIELSTLGTFFKAMASLTKSIEISISTDGVPGLFFRDPGGIGLINNNGGVFFIGSAANMNLSATNVVAGGSWTFPQIINGNITGHAASADYATIAGRAAAADELAPSGEIAWGQVLKNGSNVADLEVKNLSALTQNSSFRTVTDAEKSTWNTVNDKASKTLPPWTAATLQNGWSNVGGSQATAAFYKDDTGVVRIKGLITGGTVAAGTLLFTLPVGFRPSENLIPIVGSYNGSTLKTISLDILTNGSVKIGAVDSFSSWISLDGISSYRV